MKIFIHSGTHWDREWYQPFQGFRFRLVGATDGVINTLETRDDYGVFHFDGQTIVLEDYLEIEPENRKRLEKLIQAGKIVIGPWYCMPDEFLLSGESLIKNLQLGHKIARKDFCVEPCKNGYICDIFGHIAQMPQIFAGMDIHNSVLGRGTNESTTATHFRWQALDGTDVVVYRLPDQAGYGDFCNIAANVPTSLPDDELDSRLKAYIDQYIEQVNIPIICLFDATDHIGIRPDTRRYVDSLKRIYPDAEIYHTNISEMNAAVTEYYADLPIKSGELNETAKEIAPYLHLITNTLSSRYPIKKYNDQMQSKLEKWMAPIYALRQTGASKGFLELANKFLIRNHPHDSICGCSIDQVHRDMLYRFDQVRLLSNEIITPFNNMLSGKLVSDILTNNTGDPKKILRIYNPLPYADTRTVTAQIRFEAGFPKYAEPFGYESICNFKLYDVSGNEIPYGINDIQTYGDHDNYTITFRTTLTASNVNEFAVIPMSMPARKPYKLPGTSVSAEGEKISVTVNPNGSIKIEDRENGEIYDNLMTFIDDGEIGDGWFHCNPAIDKIITNNEATIEKIENTTASITFRVVQKLMLPKAIDRSHNGTRRSDEYEPFYIQNYITVYRSERYVKVKTVIDNNICDHRLKLRLSTGVVGNEYEANQPFGFVKRKTGIKPGTEEWKEMGVCEKQTSGIVVKRSGNRGFAFISEYGIHECAVWENGDIDITLFRSFSKTVGTAGEPDGELLETLEFSYILRPLDSRDTDAKLQREQDFLQTGFLFATATDNAPQLYRPNIELHNENFIYTTANPLDSNSSEVRIYNCSENCESGAVTLPSWVSRAWLTEIDGRIIKELPISNGAVQLKLSPWKIATVKMS